MPIKSTRLSVVSRYFADAEYSYTTVINALNSLPTAATINLPFFKPLKPA
jgi:hypothetical protein